MRIPETHIDKTADLLKAIANEKRLVVLCALSEGEKKVGELEKIVGLSQSALSQHLARLRRDNVVTTRRCAQTIYYDLRCPKTRQLVDILCDMAKQDEENQAD